MFYLLRRALLPTASLRKAVEEWAEVSVALRENPRKRVPQLASLAAILS
jgi:hypothetical protein